MNPSARKRSFGRRLNSCAKTLLYDGQLDADCEVRICGNRNKYQTVRLIYIYTDKRPAF